MNKHSLLIKKIKKQFLSINSLLESYFNKLKYFKSNIKKSEIIKNNRVFFGLSAVVILTFSYFLIPTLYDKDVIQTKKIGRAHVRTPVTSQSRMPSSA